MSATSAGLLLYRFSNAEPEVFLVHPGGPYWTKKDDGAWSIPKGEITPGEDPLATARREFLEETGFAVSGNFEPLQPIRQAGGKLVIAWVLRADVYASQVRSNTFSLEWPPKSGRLQSFPEVDRAAWFPLPVAERKILKSQVPLLRELRHLLGRDQTR